MNFWHNYKYKNLTLLGLSLVCAFFLLQNEFFHSLLIHLGNWGYLGAFLAGILFVSTFTISIGAVILFILADNGLSSWEIAIFAGLGGVVFDYIVFQTIRSNDLFDEIKNVFEYMGGNKINHLLKTKYFSWTLPVIGALLIALPFPDELGVSLLGISKMKPRNFLILTFILDFVGVLVVIFAAKIF